MRASVLLVLLGVLLPSAAQGRTARMGALQAEAGRGTLVVTGRLRCGGGRPVELEVRASQAASATAVQRSLRVSCRGSARRVRVEIDAPSLVFDDVQLTVRAREARRLAGARTVSATVPVRPPPGRRALPRDFVGVNASGLIEHGDAALRDRQLEAIRAAGVGSVRLPAGWSIVEPSAPRNGVHAYDWSQLDAQATDLARHRLGWYAIIGSSPTWASLVPYYAAAARTDAEASLLAYVDAFAARYGRGGSFWAAHPQLPPEPVEDYEFWNEPNALIDLWTPAQLGRLYLAARAAIRRHDAQAVVVLAGFADFGPDDAIQGTASWIARTAAATPGLRGNVDAIGVHLYGRSADDDEARLRVVRGQTDASLGDVPLDVSEVGWTTRADPLCALCAPPVDEAAKTSDFAQLMARWPGSDCDLRRIIPYVWLSDDKAGATQYTNTGNGPGYGLADGSGALKPSGAAFAAGVAALGAPATVPDAPVRVCR